jgi:hypothetical protein
MLGWDRYGFDKVRTRACYAEVLFLHPVGSTGDLVLFGASGSRNVHAIFFMLGWD